MTVDSSALLQITADLTRSLCARDRYQRLLEAVRSLVPCDATALLALRGRQLVPLATHGLSEQVLGMRFELDEHPRLARIVAADEPVRFPADSPLADPFDALIDGAPDALDDVHDCLGCPLVVEGEVVGVLTADALSPEAFDGLDRELLVALGVLAGAALYTARLIETVEELADKRSVVVRELSRSDESELLGVSEAMEALRSEIESVARSDLDVLITGETGVGKELVARAIHARSARRDGPLVHVNCAALPESVVESELFGHVRGAFTGADSDRLGKFEVADGGTLLLDEIGELPLAIQPKLLRVLQEGEIQRVGSDRLTHVDVRIVAVTNRTLEREVSAGRFRADLYHRLAVYPIRVAPLRERTEDIGVLAGHFLDRYRSRFGARPMILAGEAARSLRGHPWPGNVRELEHVLARAALRAANRSDGRLVEITAADLDLAEAPRQPAPVAGEALTRRAVGGELPLREAVDAFKRQVVERALAESGGSLAGAARKLGMHRSNLHHLARRLELR